MDTVLGTSRKAGWPEAHLLHEFFFGSGPVKSDVSEGSFEIKVANSGRIVVVPAAKTVIEAPADAGDEVPTSREQGVCGTCLTRVSKAKPITATCISRPRNRGTGGERPVHAVLHVRSP
jgi:vanillate O-demethylase ferredoxin subunit